MVRLHGSIARLVAPALVLSAVPLAGFGAMSSVASPAANAERLQEIRSFPTGDVGVSVPEGLAWDARRQALVLLDGGTPVSTVEVTPEERRLDGRRLAGVREPGAVAVSPDGVTTAVSGDTLLSFAETGVERTPGTGLSLDSPGGAAYDDAGALFVLDGDAIVRRDARGEVERTPVSAGAGADLRGLSSRPDSSLLYTYDATGRELLGVDRRGNVKDRFDLSKVAVEDVRGVVVAPSADSTDDPSTQSVYLADAGGPETSGQLVEVALTEQFAVAAAVGGTVVRTVDTSRYSPPSPDPSGVAYLPQADRLMIADGEVDEMSIFRNANLFLTTRAGAVESTGNSLPLFREPVGVGYNPGNNHLFISDDDQKEVYEFVAGGDGRFGTSDDTVTHFDTAGVGAGDPEGVEYDPVTNSVWTVDGVNKEVYRFRPGPDGRFGTSDDLHSNFDVARYGAGDPEGIGYDSVRDTLVVLDDNSRTIYELDRNGSLLNTISLSGAGMVAAAGITVAPGSQDPSRRNYYAVARGVDNNDDPNENDGKMYEISATLPPIGGPSNTAPVVSAGADASVVLPASASLDGTVSDDGLPEPPSVTTTWSRVSGPGVVTFGNAAAVDTSASFSAAGTYVLRLTANDGALSSFDEVTVTVSSTSGGGTQTVDVRVSAGSDDAEQDLSGLTDLTSTDLELTTEGTIQQVVGMRFAGLAIPAGATVTNAYVQFQTDEVSTAAASLTIKAETSDNAPTYQATSGNVTSRATTAQSVAWSPSAWSLVGEAAAAQRTPDLTALVQAVVGRSGWVQGNALALQVSGSGTRTAEAFNGVASAAPLLHVAYTTGSGGGGTNQAPVVSAGADASVVLPASASLDGTVSDDGLPEPPSVTTTWSQVGGPGVVTFGNAAAVDTSASFSAAGTYVLRLTANDGALSSFDEVTVTVSASGTTNQAPVVSAGADASVVLPASASLDGTVSDDGLPNPPGAVTTRWSQGSGPGSVTFGDATAVDTSASFSAAGTYVLRLTADDGALSSFDEVTVTVSEPGPVNQAPVVDAGPDASVVLPNSLSLDGTVSDDGLPVPPGAVTTTWSKAGGPGPVRFANNSAVDTTVTFTKAGTFVLRLTASDGALTSSDQVTVVVSR